MKNSYGKSELIFLQQEYFTDKIKKFEIQQIRYKLSPNAPALFTHQ